jgi:shikimate dehydrogenase
MKNQPVTGKTTICGVIGDPIEHTLSPAMHNAAFKALALDWIYVPFRVVKADLSRALYGVRSLNIKGMNITIPHKIAITAMLDELDSPAMNIGAVNTIVNDRGKLKGFNTDASGFIRAFTEQGIALENKNAVVLGAGGASRAVCFALAGEKAGVTILNRTPGTAEELAADISNISIKPLKAAELNAANLENALPEADILVNTTSTGMNPNADNTLVTAEMINPKMIVYDIVYSPARTRLLMEAGKAGARTISGIEMLLWQGVQSFEIWTGLKAPVEIMRHKLIETMKSNED